MTFGEALIEGRKRKKMSQDQLAKALGISRISVASWETQSYDTRLSLAIHASRLLGFSLDKIEPGQMAKSEWRRRRAQVKIDKLKAEIAKIEKTTTQETP